MNKFFLIAFVLFSNSVFSVETLRRALVGDAGQSNLAIQNLRQAIANDKVYDLVLLGDNLYEPKNSTYAQVWNPWLQMGFQFLGVAIGNHNKNYAEEVAYFKMPAQYYSYADHGVRFVILNSDNVKMAKQQAIFLENILQSCSEKQVYVVLHHPFVTISDHHRWEDRAQFQVLFRQVLQKYGERVTAVFSGHDHFASMVDVSGLPLIVSGASFEAHVSPVLNYQDGPFRVMTRWSYKGGSHWVRMTMAADASETWIEYVQVDRPMIVCSVRLYPKPYVLGSNCR